MELDNLPYLDIDIHFPHEKYQTKSHTDIPKKATYCHVARGKLFYMMRKQQSSHTIITRALLLAS